MSYDYLVKLIVIGESSVGKSTIVSRWVGERFDPFRELTIGVEFKTKRTKIDQSIIKTQIWDTAGQETFAPIITTYFRECAGALLVFDVGRRKTFQKLDYWREQVHLHNKYRNVPIILIGNKIDNQREVTTSEAEKYAKKYNIKYIETSAKNNIHMQDCYNLLVNEIYNTMDKELPGTGIKKGLLTGIIKIDKEYKHPNSQCCSWS